MTTYLYKDGDKELIANQMEDIENVSYRETMIKFHASSIAPVIKTMLKNDKNFNLPYNDDIIGRVALMFAEQTYNDFTKGTVDDVFKNIFQKELNKKQQIRLLRGMQLTNTQLSSLFNFADECGYKFSHYKWQGDPKSVKDEKLPSFMHLKDDGNVEYMGETTLTEGQMRTIIDQADVLIARVFDNGIHWHCFLQTYKGLKGKEAGVQGSRPHLHYLSDSFGISKDDLIKMIKMGRYPNTPVHILLSNDKIEKK